MGNEKHEIHRLDRLPLELTSLIAGELDAASLGALRLVSKQVETIFAPHFLCRINEVQTIDFTLCDIRRLRFLSLNTYLRSAVSVLRFVSPYYHMTPAKVGSGTTTPGDLYPRRQNALVNPLNLLQAPNDRLWMEQRIFQQSSLNEDPTTVRALLTEVLRNFSALSGLCLEAAVILSPEARWAPERVEHLDWRQMWKQNMESFRGVISSIAKSQIQLDRLELFKDTSICSIPINEVSVTQMDGFEKVASRLKHFSISLSTAVREPVYSEPPHTQGVDSVRLENDMAISRSEAKGADDVARLIQAMPRLESIYFHFYQTCLFNDAPTRGLGLLENVFQSASASFNHLTDMSLSCVPITPTTLESILRRCPQLQSLSLRFVQLDQDIWVQALTPLISSPVKYVYLSNLLSTTYDPGFKVTRNNMVLNERGLRARHPGVTVAKRSDSDPPGTRVGGSLLMELDSEVPNSGMAGGRQVQWTRTRLLLCGPPCRMGQHLFGNGI